MRIAIFGGTFDPIHHGHLVVAREAAKGYHLDKILFIPAANPPHKRTVQRAPYKDRLRMVEIACDAERLFEASDAEAGEQTSYSIRTVRKILAGLEPEDELFFLIGADAFAEIESWFEWRELLGLVRFIVVSRPGHEYDVPEKAKVLRLEGVQIPASSSDIRREIAAGGSPAELPPGVLRYIQEKRLYRGGGG